MHGDNRCVPNQEKCFRLRRCTASSALECSRMNYAIEDSWPKKLVITIKSRPAPKELLITSLLFAYLLADEVLRRHHYVFASTLLVLLVLEAVCEAVAGEQLEFAGCKVKHRIPMLGFHVPNQSFAVEQVRRVRYVIYRRLWFRDRTAIGFTYKGKDYLFGQDLTPEDASQIINVISAKFPGVTSES